MIEYRPCIVTETIYPADGQQGIIEHKKHNALFHCWIKRTIINFKAEHYIAGGFVIRENNTNGEYLIGVVEYEDGTIHECLSNNLQFTDEMFQKFRKK